MSGDGSSQHSRRDHIVRKDVSVGIDMRRSPAGFEGCGPKHGRTVDMNGLGINRPAVGPGLGAVGGEMDDRVRCRATQLDGDVRFVKPATHPKLWGCHDLARRRRLTSRHHWLRCHGGIECLFFRCPRRCGEKALRHPNRHGSGNLPYPCRHSYQTESEAEQQDDSFSHDWRIRQKKIR